MKKEKILIYHHLGLGDHFNCNGLVRYLYKKNKFIGTMKKWHYVYLNYKKKNLSYFLKKIKLNLSI